VSVRLTKAPTQRLTYGRLDQFCSQTMMCAAHIGKHSSQGLVPTNCCTRGRDIVNGSRVRCSEPSPIRIQWSILGNHEHQYLTLNIACHCLDVSGVETWTRECG